jgi:hypothetical protein
VFLTPCIFRGYDVNQDAHIPLLLDEADQCADLSFVFGGQKAHRSEALVAERLCEAREGRRHFTNEEVEYEVDGPADLRALGTKKVFCCKKKCFIEKNTFLGPGGQKGCVATGRYFNVRTTR